MLRFVSRSVAESQVKVNPDAFDSHPDIEWHLGLEG